MCIIINRFWSKYCSFERLRLKSHEDVNVVSHLCLFLAFYRRRANSAAALTSSLIGHRNKMQKSINAMKLQHYNGGMDAD